MDKYYEIKVTIRESHPLTWRRLRIPANITFNDLAAIIEKIQNSVFESLDKIVDKQEKGNE